MIISKTIEFDMGHRVPNHKSKCRNLHGHRYKIEVFVDGHIISKKGDSSEGMVIDFSDLKQIMMDVIDKELDHGFMMYREDTLARYFKDFKDGLDQKVIFVDFIPTAENIAKYIFNKLKKELELKKIKLVRVEVYETPTSKAIYE